MRDIIRPYIVICIKKYINLYTLACNCKKETKAHVFTHFSVCCSGDKNVFRVEFSRDANKVMMSENHRRNAGH